MANSLAALKVTLSYPSGGGTITVPAMSINAPFQGMNAAVIDVPDLEASATSHAVPFGSVASASAVLIKNKTGQDLNVKINGAAAASHSIPDEGVLLLAAETVATATAITSCAVITSAIQAGAGQIECWVFGDPT